MSHTCLCGEAIHLQCFMPMRYVKKRGIPAMYVHITLTTFTRLAQSSTVGSMLTLYGSTMLLALIFMYVATLYGLIGLWRLSGKFFCLVY